MWVKSKGGAIQDPRGRRETYLFVPNSKLARGDLVGVGKGLQVLDGLGL